MPRTNSICEYCEMAYPPNEVGASERFCSAYCSEEFKEYGHLNWEEELLISTKKVKKTVRSCMCCGAKFESCGIGDRLCEYCLSKPTDNHVL